MRNATKAVLLALAAGFMTIVGTPAAHADPCFFGSGDFANWYDGARWGDSLTHVESAYAHCTGTWVDTVQTWNGRNEKVRVWPRADGGQTKIYFAQYSDAPTWRAHDMAETSNDNVDPTPYIRVECEWPRGNNGGCREIHVSGKR